MQEIMIPMMVEVPVYDLDPEDYDHLITEDDEPVDNIPSEKQQRLLTESLYSSLAETDRKFLVCANVGIFALLKGSPVVPDVLLSMDVEVHEDWWAKAHRTYYIWEYGKSPDVAIEIVSNKVGDELGGKLKKYARMKVGHYVVYDPTHQLSAETLTIFHLDGLTYRRDEARYFPDVKLGLTLWEGEYEGIHTTWLRWVDELGNLIATGREGKEQERAAKEQERAAKEEERAAKEAALQRTAKLEALLRQLGQDPNQV